MSNFINRSLFIYAALLFYSIFSSVSFLVAAYPIAPSSHVASHHSVPLVKRITSIFPNAGHNSTTFNTVHLIAAVIGIVGATLLVVVLFIYYKRKRRSSQQLHQHLIIGAPANLHIQSPLKVASAQHTTHHRAPSSSSSNSAMSQFQVFQSDYYYDDKNASSSLSQSILPSSLLLMPERCYRIETYRAPEPSNTLSPPPYKP